MSQVSTPEGKLAAHAGVGCVRGLALQLVAVVVVVPVIVGILVLMLVLVQDRRAGPFVGFAVAMTLMAMFFTAFAGGLFAWTQSRLRQLDRGFAALGDVRGKMYLQNGRLWRGTVGNRQLDAYLFRGPTIELYVSGALRTRLGASRPGFLSGLAARALGREPVSGLDPAFDVYAPEPEWARAVLADPGVRLALPRLLADDASLRVLTVLPDAVMLRIAHVRLGAMTDEAIRTCVDDLATLAAAGEAVVPAEILASTPAEVSNRTARGVVAARISCAIFLVFGVVFVVLLAVALIVAFTAT